MLINIHFGLDRYNFAIHINFLLYFFVSYFLIALVYFLIQVPTLSTANKSNQPQLRLILYH